MSFYEQISTYYDNIFPVSEDTLKFIKSIAVFDDSKILDIACGTGGYSVNLSKEGYFVYGIDLEDEMIRLAKIKNKKENSCANFLKCNMSEVDKKFSEEFFDLCFCIGNSIVHLGSHKEIEEVLKKINKITAKKGKLILQIINFDRIYKHKISSLPTLTDKNIGMEFNRNYRQGEGIIYFETKLNIDNGNEKSSFENTIELKPILQKDLSNILISAGFNNIKLYGDFNGSDYSEDSFLLVVVAEKA